MLTGCEQKSGSEGPVIAKVDNGVITAGDFVAEVSRVPEWARNQFAGKEGKDKFLDELVKRELIYQNAKEMNLDKDKEYTSKIEQFKKMTLVSLILKKEVEDKAFVDDAEVKAFFDQNEDKFTVGTKIKASHILVKTEEEAKEIADKINSGEDFAGLAKSRSQDKGSAQKGGDLGYFGRGQMVPEFERAAISLKPGEVSAPVQTRFGYHIIKLTDIKKGEKANFEQSKDAIRKQLLAEKRKKLFDAYVERLKAKSKVTLVEENLEGITLPWEIVVEEPAQESEPTPEE